MQPTSMEISGETIMVTLSAGDASVQLTGDAVTLKRNFPGLFDSHPIELVGAIIEVSPENDVVSVHEAGEVDDPFAGELIDSASTGAEGGVESDRPPTLAELSQWFSTMALKLRKLQVRVDEWENEHTAAIAAIAHRVRALEAGSRETHERLNAVCNKLAGLQSPSAPPEWGVEPQEQVRRVDALANSATELRSITTKQGELIAALGKDVESLTRLARGTTDAA